MRHPLKQSPEPWQWIEDELFDAFAEDVDLTNPKNLRRVVACVNACVGIPNEVLEDRRHGWLKDCCTIKKLKF